MPSPPSPTQAWQPNEFVVALPHLPVVVGELQNLPQPVTMQQPSESAVLDLALITITNVEESARLINSVLGPGERCVCREFEYPIDRVIRAIRESCQRKYGGWIPTIGKNRMLDGVHTTQHVGTGRTKFPKPVASEDLGSLSTNGVSIGTMDRPFVGVLDTGIWAHTDLDGRYLPDEPDVYLQFADPQSDAAGHGTFVAGMVVQDSPNVGLRIRKVLDQDGTALAWHVAEEMVTLARSVDVLNVSFACFTDDNEEPLVLARAIELIDRETVIVAAAGNFADPAPETVDAGAGPTNDRRAPTAPNSPMWPAASSRVIAVGAHDRDGRRAPFSPDVPWVDLTASGVDVASLYLDGKVEFQGSGEKPTPNPAEFSGYASWTGTSFAAAMASGVIARRIRKGDLGISARQALAEVMSLPAGNSDKVWRYQSASTR